METWAFEPLASPSAGALTSNLVASVTVTATNASATASTQLPGPASGNYQRNMQIANTTTSWAYVNFGELGSLTAATVAASYPVAPGAVVVVTTAPDVNAASVILGATSTATAVIFTRGVGL